MERAGVTSALLLVMLLTKINALPSVLPKTSPALTSRIDQSTAHTEEEHVTEDDDPLLAQMPQPSYEALVLTLERQPELRANFERHRTSSTDLGSILQSSREAVLVKHVEDGAVERRSTELRRARGGDPCNTSTNRICAAVRRIKNLTVKHAEHRNRAVSNEWPTNFLFSSLNFTNHHGNADTAATKYLGDSVSTSVVRVPLKEREDINKKLSTKDVSRGTDNASRHASEVGSPSPSPSRADVATADKTPRPTDAQSSIYHHQPPSATPPSLQPANRRREQDTNPDKHHSSVQISEAGPLPPTVPSSQQSSGSRHPPAAAPNDQDSDAGGAGESDGPDDDDSAPLVYRAISAEEVFKGAQRYTRRPRPAAVKAGTAGILLPGRRDPPSRRAKLFSCHGRSEGFYPDPDTGCQEYHQCTRDGHKFKYQCGGGTVFNVKTKVCDHPHSAECKTAARKATAL